MRKSRGHVVFDGLTEEAFVDLVQQTLEESAFIETEWADVDATLDDDVLVIYEVTDE